MTEDERVLIFALSDLHFDIKSARRIFDNLKKYFFNELEENIEEVDAVVITGDIFHKKISIDSECAYIVMQFMHDLIEIMDGKPIRIIKGTRTHDYNQLDIFKIFETDNVKVVNSVSEEELVEGLEVCYVPEEYPINFEEYYEDYIFEEEIEDKWDIIFGHGMIDFAAHSSIVQESERPIHSAPVFKSSSLLNSAVLSIFGHVHTSQTHKKAIHYVGSFAREAHGEEKAKGWTKIYYDTDDKSFELERVENEDALLFTTIKLSNVYDNELTIKENIKAIKKKLKHIDNLRIKIDIEDDKVNSDIAIIKEHFSNDGSLKLHKENIIKREDKKDEDRFEFLKEAKEAPVEDTIQKFAKEKLNRDIDKEDIKIIISPKSK